MAKPSVQVSISGNVYQPTHKQERVGGGGGGVSSDQPALSGHLAIPHGW